MAEFPAMPWWTDAYFADTGDLTMLEHGGYMVLLAIAWRRPDNALPDDMEWLKRAVGAHCAELHGRTFNAVVPKLLSRFFVLSDGVWRQNRLDREREFLREQSAKQRDRVMKRWRKGAEIESKSSRNEVEMELKSNLKGIDTSPSFVENQTHTEYAGNTPTPTPTVSKKERTPSYEGVRKKEPPADKPPDAPPAAAPPAPRVSRASQIDPNWRPGDKDREFARQQGFDDAAIDRMADQFRDHHRAKGSVMKDWPAAFRTWVRNENKYTSRSPPLQQKRKCKVDDFAEAMRILRNAERC